MSIKKYTKNCIIYALCKREACVCSGFRLNLACGFHVFRVLMFKAISADAFDYSFEIGSTSCKALGNKT